MPINTRQRKAIRDVLVRAGRPLGAREVLQAAQASVPGLGLATVYRALRTLAEEDVIHAVALPGEAPRYEVAGKAHHHHFCCGVCGGVFEVDGCLDDEAGLAALTPAGFRLAAHEIILYGECVACRDQAARPGGE